MTLLLTEGFDWLETADLPAAYGAMGNVQPVGTMTQTIEEAGGRNGDKSLKITPGTGTSDHRFNSIQGKSFPLSVAAGAEVIFGFAIKFDTTQESGNLAFCGINNGGVSTFTYNVNLIRLSNGFIAAGFSQSTLYSGASGSTVMNSGIWYYIECKFVSHSSAGSIEVRINGVVEFNVTGLDTTQTTNNNISLDLGCIIPDVTLPVIEFDDLYICDSNGSINNDYLGDIQVKALFPNGNGNTSNFTGSDANSVDNFLHVDDGPAPDDDSSYVEDGTSGNKDLYTFDNLPSGASDIKAIAVKTLGKKTGAGGPDLKNVVRTGTTEADSSILGLGVNYLAKQTIQELDPDTVVAWTPSGVDAMEAGVKVE